MDGIACLPQGRELAFDDVVGAFLAEVGQDGRAGTPAQPEDRRGAGAGRPALDIGGATFPERGKPSIEGGATEGELRHYRAKERRQLRAISAAALPKEAVARCGQYAGGDPGLTVDDQRFVAVQRGQHGAFFGNVVSCKSVWHCPVCAARIAQERRRGIATAISQHMAHENGLVVMVTLTAQHSKSDDVKALRQSMTARWRKVRSGRIVQEMDKSCGMVGGVRVFEVTNGENGWHPHFHILLFFRPVDDDANEYLKRIDRYCAYVVDRWLSFCASDGNGAQRQGQDWQYAASPEEAGEYVTKWGPDWEMTHGHLKKGNLGGRSPWQILMDIRDYNRQEDIALFQQYAIAFKGAKQLNWFGSVREEIEKADTDTEVSEKNEEENSECVGYLSDGTYQALVKMGLELDLLRAVEVSGYLGLLAFLGGYGIGLGGVRPADWGPLMSPEDRRRVAASTRSLTRSTGIGAGTVH